MSGTTKASGRRNAKDKPAKRVGWRKGASNRLPPALAKLPLSVVFDWATGVDGDGKPNFAGVHPSYMRRLIPFWAPLKVGDRTPAAAERYMEAHAGAVSGRTKRPFSEQSVVRWLRYLGTVLKHYAPTVGTTFDDPLSFPTAPKHVPRVLTFGEASRIHQAILGRTWCPAEGRMRRTDRRPPHGLSKLARRCRNRILPVALGTAVSDPCLLALRWTGSPDGAQSYVDVDEGLLHRLGDHAPAYEKVRTPVKIPQTLLARLRRWRARDQARGIDHVFHGEDGGPIMKVCAFDVIRDAIKRAGLKGIEYTTFRDTCAAIALRCGASIYSVSIFVGLSPLWVNVRYGVFQRDYQKRAVAALSSRPTKPRFPTAR